MLVKEKQKTLENSKEFKEWKKNNPSCYLVHCFNMVDSLNKDIWQIGYYNNKTDRITTFALEKDNIKTNPESEVFKKGKKIIKLDLEKVNIDFPDAIKTAKEFQEEHFNKDKPSKIIAILQHLPDSGQVWNTTFITASFNVLNMKIDASSGDMKSHKCENILEFKEK